LATVLASDAARAAVAIRNTEETVRLAVRFFRDGATAGAVSASVGALVNGVLRTMFINKLRMTLVPAVLAIALGALGMAGAQEAKKKAEEAPRQVLRQASEPGSLPPPVAKKSSDTWPLTLREAIRLALESSRAVRVVKRNSREECTISPAINDADAQWFRAAVMEMVRSVEQQYWALVQEQAALKSAQMAVDLCEAIVHHTLSELELGRGGPAEVASARQRLENFRVQLMTRTSDVITTERQFRRILGLPLVDDRRIVPITRPIESLVEPDWDESLKAMHEKHPNVARAERSVEEVDAARDGLLERDRREAALERAVHQATHSLARFFLEVDSNYKQFKTASNLRAAAYRRQASERAAYEAGQAPIDRHLDAIEQYANACALEAQFRTAYNVAIVALEEAKGTLLEYDKISVADRPPAGAASARTPEGASTRITPEPLLSASRSAAAAPVDTAVARTNLVEGPATQGSKTISFQVTVGRGPRPLEIRGSFTITPAKSNEPAAIPPRASEPPQAR
jgi:hypothetical protein